MGKAAMCLAASALVLVGTANAAVLCVKSRKDGALNGAVKVREACKPGEVQLAPEDVGFCCTTSTTTTMTTTSTCPTFTPTTLGIVDCGFANVCFGLCANARACAGPEGQCSCTGAELPCGVVTYDGLCGGACPTGQTCGVHTPTLPNGCPDIPRCACVPVPEP